MSVVLMNDPSVARTLSHSRNIDLKGYRRADGLYDIEATLVDVKGIRASTPDRPEIPVGEALHDMSMCLTINIDMEILAVKTSMDAAPYVSCPEIAQAYQSLVGVVIGAGWTRKVKDLFGGVKGCTHLRELLGPMATVALQTIVDEECRTKDYLESAGVFKSMIGGCYGLAEDGENVKRLWPALIKEEMKNVG